MMSRFEDNLWESVIEQHGDNLSQAATRAVTTRRRTNVRQRVLAGGTTGLACVGAALAFALAGSTAPPAYAITTGSDGSLLVKFNYEGPATWFALEHELIGQHNEMLAVEVAPGPASTPGPMACTPMTDADPGTPPTPIRVELGQNGTGTIPQGDTNPVPGGTQSGPVHLTACQLFIERPADGGAAQGFGFNLNGSTRAADSTR